MGNIYRRCGFAPVVLVGAGPMSTVPKCIVKMSDMAEDMETDAINYAVDGLDKFNTEKEVAQYLRKAFVDKVCRATARRHGRSPSASVVEPTPQRRCCNTPPAALPLEKASCEESSLPLS